ncbi:hypothetical protein [Falsiroseomonas tokyonensis]|uniref:Tat pathway signal sequence domain protein n=1 Tax=Falsiroseomonas tokyonensis TaxID=430521 RepID=A0ABV7BRZ7_9PROT|nr:hypothetical protein [Falsiroseomonas tokyonensis]MBU8538409.1 hypothetical protein [Falsiroseomonas tokyonensis]
MEAAMTLRMRRDLRALASLTAAALTIMALGGGAPAAAQQASFCGGALVGQSFYSTVQSTSAGAVVDYHGVLQNQDPQRRTLVALLLPVSRMGQFSVAFQAPPITLRPNEQKTVLLLRLRLNNPSGAGAPTSAQLANEFRLSCSFS